MNLNVRDVSLCLRVRKSLQNGFSQLYGVIPRNEAFACGNTGYRTSKIVEPTFQNSLDLNYVYAVLVRGC